jgi:chromosome segregation ATPase
LRQTATYRVKGSATSPQLIVEHPRHAGFRLTMPDPSGVEMTAGAYRIPANLVGGETALIVVEDQPLEETVRLLDAEDDEIGALAVSTELDAKLRQTLTDLGARRQALTRQRTELDRLKEQRGQLVDDETRLRDDLTALGRDTALRKRLLDKFADTETAIDTITAATAKAETALTAAQKELASYVAGLKL